MDGLLSSKGGTAPYRPLWSVLYRGGGEALYRPLCLVLYEGNGSLLSPMFGSIEQGGAALYRPLCSDLYSMGGRLSTVPCVRCCISLGEDSSLPASVFGFMYNFLWRLGEGTVSDTASLIGRVEVE